MAQEELSIPLSGEGKVSSNVPPQGKGSHPDLGFEY